MGTPSDHDRTAVRIDAWFQGDHEALGSLLRDNLEWMQLYVRRELEPALRKRFDSIDVVHEAVVRMLDRGPRYAPRCQEEFRALLAKVVRGALVDQRKRERAAKRDVGRDHRLPSRGLSRFAPGSEAGGRPESELLREERTQAVRRALDRLAPDDAAVLRLRQLEGLPFAEVAERLGLEGPDAARMRFHRALPRLARALDQGGEGAAG